MIPSKEQFDSLYDILKPPGKNPISNLLKPDSPRGKFAGYFEGCLATIVAKIEEVQKTKPGKWLFDQQNFVTAFERIFNPIQIKTVQHREFADRLADLVLRKIEREIQRNRENGATIELWTPDSIVFGFNDFVNRTVLDWTKWMNSPLTWGCAVIDALREYHYGQAHQLSVSARSKVEEYLDHAEELLRLNRELSAATGKGFWLPSPRGRHTDIFSELEVHVKVLKPAHDDGTLYAIRRNDAAAKARIFIATMAIAHQQLFQKKHNQVIADLFYLEGMGYPPNTRTIERIANEAIKRNHAKYCYEDQIRKAERSLETYATWFDSLNSALGRMQK